MLIKARTAALALTLAASAAVPGVALAKHGADDPPGDDRGGQRIERGGGDDRGGDDRRGGGGGDRATRVTGSCSAGTTSKLKVKPDDGRLEVEFEVDQNRNGVTWKVRIRRNGNLAVKVNATTRAPSGSFSVERRIADGAGSDRVFAKGISPSGEVCTATITR